MRSTRDVTVLESEEVSSLVASDTFLKQSEDIGGIAYGIYMGCNSRFIKIIKEGTRKT